MEVSKFNVSSDIMISRCLEFMNESFYYGSAQIKKIACEYGSSPNWCQYYIVRVENMWGNCDVYHFAAKMDGSGEIDYIKIQPERNRNSDKILQGCSIN